MTWSSKQHLSQEDLLSLQRDLLALYMNLVKEDLRWLEFMKTSKNMTLDTIWKNIENAIHINQGSV